MRNTSLTGGGSFTTDYIRFNLDDNLDLTITTAGGALDLLDGSGMYGVHTITLNAGAGNITLDVYKIETSGDQTYTADTVVSQASAYNYLSSFDGNLTVNAKITLSVDLYLRSGQNLTLNGYVDGLNNFNFKDLYLYSDQTITINEDIYIHDLYLSGGDVTFGNNYISAFSIYVFGATFGAGTGTVNADTVELIGGSLAPGGLGAVGSLTIEGDVVFNGGDLVIDFGPNGSDQLKVLGDVIIVGGNLGGALGTGSLTNSNPVSVLTYNGILSGTFDNAPTSTTSVFMGAEVVNVSYGLATGPGDILVKQAQALPAGVALTGTEADGTAYSVKLRGGGIMVAGTDASGYPFVLVRDSTSTSRLTVTTTANASDKVVYLSSVSAAGPLAGFNGAQVDVGVFKVAGFAKSITIHELYDAMTLGGTAADKTILTATNLDGSVTATSSFLKILVARDVEDDITAAAIGTLRATEVQYGTIETTGSIGSIATTQDFTSDVQAGSVGMVKVGRYLSDGTWKVTQGINSISAAAISNLNLTARNLGSLSANGTPDGEISGSIYSSAFTLTGDDGTSRHYGLRTVRATGTVLSSDFSVKAGNVDRVTVGRFLYSNLYLNYTPGGAFNMTGSFNSTTQHKLNRFSTTATTIGDPNNSSNFAFADSEIVADTIGTVRLSGVQTKNFGTAFGIKFRTSATSVQVKSADSVAIPFNTNLTPSGTALANEFFYLDV